ncbi:flagellar biosynthesis protein FliQ [Thermosulfuriphilus ammonigenes]|uniref:Flagellar biosynthetic protein FliQ n=1 Tax=Thermosulfuriphilus ammonigenes TaxID=1936021 RepID=A0A6G7PYQ3_9BACT|nr:flagellar biosynthesis protein FliQ [Thermosulfuriphilus ammonigenes]MBA2849801.1 flagellar biosynthetic protein FliQ [Thermosulfuriphilus ammonigenes]QIJ72651.1 flagellar biosynthesis protein FliQ [Thermosulfuriphilus ammonigenes]
MNQEVAVGMARQAVEITLLLSLPMLGIGLVVGLLVSIFQAATQIQEMTLTFVPKIVAVLLALVLFFPWMMEKLVTYTAALIAGIPDLIR